MARSEFFMDICFIREQAPNAAFKDIVEEMLKTLFKGKVHWYLDYKQEDNLEVIVAEIKGMVAWVTEEEVIEHIEDQAPAAFWDIMKGYRIQVYPNFPRECGETCSIPS